MRAVSEEVTDGSLEERLRLGRTHNFPDREAGKEHLGSKPREKAALEGSRKYDCPWNCAVEESI